jgi:hypothetical protein
LFVHLFLPSFVCLCLSSFVHQFIWLYFCLSLFLLFIN